MRLRLTRLRPGECWLGIGSALLLIDLFGVTWFRYQGHYHAGARLLAQRLSANGWQAFEVIGPLALIVSAVGVSICGLAAARRSPALPVVATTLLTPVALVLAVLVAIRVLLDPPSVLGGVGGANVAQTGPGAYVGLAASLAIFAGLYLALRRDGVAAEDSPAAIEVLRV